MSFNDKLLQLRIETREHDWDSYGAEPIPTKQWDYIEFHLMPLIAKELPDLPEPHPSAGGDGSIYLRWNVNGHVVDMELTPITLYLTDGYGQSIIGHDGTDKDLIEILRNANRSM